MILPTGMAFLIALPDILICDEVVGIMSVVPPGRMEKADKYEVKARAACKKYLILNDKKESVCFQVREHDQS